MVPRQAGHSTAHKWLKFYPSHENSPFPKIHPKPQHTSNPLQAPPARLFTSSPPPCWLAGWQRVGGPPSSYPLIPSPSPILHSLQSHSTHLIPSVHQNLSLKVFNIHSSCHLSVQAACVKTSNFHSKIHILPAIVMMDWMKFQNWFVLILSLFVRKVLFLIKCSKWETLQLQPRQNALSWNADKNISNLACSL